MQSSTAEGCECFKFWRRQVKVLVSYHQNRCSVFIPKDAKYILMNKLCGVLFDGRDADRVILVYANLCNNLLFGKSPRAFLCLDQLLQKLDFQTVYKVYTLHGFLSKTSQELRKLSSVTLNCQVTKIVMNLGSQLSEL